MKKYLISLTCLLLTLPAAAQDAGQDLVDFGAPEALTIQSGDKTHNFNVEIADNDDKQSQGLMFRKEIAADAGMLFEFAEPKVATIWMKNTDVALDLLYIRTDGRIVKIEHAVKPQSLRSVSSEVVVAAVLELPAGRAQSLAISPGDIVKHDFFVSE